MIRNIGIRPIIFSVNCYIATILTMFVAFSLDLKSPGWAMTTVYLTSQPLSGAMRAKAVYRAIGTFVGAAAMVAIVPNLVDAPELTTLAIMLWVALCVFVSLLDRTPRSYMFVLSGYTAALIGFPSVLAPGTVFDTAVSRVEEITLGVVCAAIVHSLIFPKSVFSAFEQKLRIAIADTRRWLADGLTQQATPEAEMERRRIAADISELYLLGTSLRFDTSPHRPDISTIRAFDRKIVALLPLVSAIEDRLTLLRRIGPLDAKLSQALAGVYDWLKLQAPGDRHRAAELKEACVAATPAVGPQSSWADLVKVNLTVRLIELIDSWQACLGFAAYLADPVQTPSADIRAAAAQIGPKPMHTDPGIALLSALAAAIAMGICAFFWIATAWPEGAGAVAFAAVACTLFASLDDPTPTIRNITLLLALCIPIVLHLPILCVAGDRRIRLALRRARFCADSGRHIDGDPGLCSDRSGARLGFLCRNEPADELYRRSRDHRQFQQRFCARRRRGAGCDSADACYRHAGQRTAPDSGDLSRPCRPCRWALASDPRPMGQPHVGSRRAVAVPATALRAAAAA